MWMKLQELLKEMFNTEFLDCWNDESGSVQIMLKDEVWRFLSDLLPENARHGGSIDRIELEIVEREATPELLMKLSIQLNFSGFSLSNTNLIFDIFGIGRA